MKVSFVFTNNKREDGWYILLIPTPVFGIIDGFLEIGIFWLVFGTGISVKIKKGE